MVSSVWGCSRSVKKRKGDRARSKQRRGHSEVDQNRANVGEGEAQGAGGDLGLDLQLPGLGVVVSIGLLLFAFSTLLAWAYYGEKCAEFLFGPKGVIPYRIIYVLLVIPGAILELATVWHVADIFNGLMAIPNLLALLFLKPVLVKETELFLDKVRKEQEVTVG